MEKIAIQKEVRKKDVSFGSLKIENVFFQAKDIEDYLYKYVLDEDNIRFIFCDQAPSSRKQKNMFVRFCKVDEGITVEKFVDESMAANNSFFSFFAEALLPLVFRDVYGYKLETASIDITQTLIGEANGADGCLYDPENKVFVLGEAKFHKSFSSAMNAIIRNFVSGRSLKNKLENLYRVTINSNEPCSLILRTMGKSECSEFSFSEFLRLKLCFAGFVLHEIGNIDSCKILDDHFYDSFSITTDEVKKSLKDNGVDFDPIDFGITFFHFFIDSKRNLILMCIDKASEKAKEVTL